MYFALARERPTAEMLFIPLDLLDIAGFSVDINVLEQRGFQTIVFRHRGMKRLELRCVTSFLASKVNVQYIKYIPIHYRGRYLTGDTSLGA